MTLYSATAAGKGQNISYNGSSASFITGEGIYKNGRWTSTFTGDGVEVNGLCVDSIAGEIAAHDDTYEISYLNGQSGEGIFSINGIYAADDMSIRAVGTNLDMAQFSEFVDINLAGELLLICGLRGQSRFLLLQGRFMPVTGIYIMPLLIL